MTGRIAILWRGDRATTGRIWQGRPAHERLDAVEELIEAAHALKGWKIEPDVPG